jgi:DNA mismatch repair protein MutL
MPIQVLPKPSTIQLSSGQVLIDPSTVIKELLDNALDAHATSITIEVSANTTDYIQVRDNGVGVEPDDRGMLGRRFCTSKIRTIEDVEQLGGKSLGFRGEALSSLVAVSERCEVTTRIEGESVGVRIWLFEDVTKNKCVDTVDGSAMTD